eukprot:403341630
MKKKAQNKQQNFDEQIPLFTTQPIENQQSGSPKPFARSLNRYQQNNIQGSYIKSSTQNCKRSQSAFRNSGYLPLLKDTENHALELNPLITHELKQVKNSYSSIYYIQNLLKCFHSDEIFKTLVQSITDDVIVKLNHKTQEQTQLHEIYDMTLEGQKKNQTNLQQMIAEKRAREALDPLKLQERVQKLQAKLEKQSKDYFSEIDIYRNQMRKSNGNGLTKDLKDFFEVRLFDECDQIPPEYIGMMNQKILDIQKQYSKYVQTQLETQKVMLIKLNAFEKLKPEQYCLIDLQLDEIIEALPALEAEPQNLWNLIEKHYRPNFFDNVIYKKFGYLFENKNEASFTEQIKLIREEVKEEMMGMAKNYENTIKALKSDFSEKLMENYELKEKYQMAYEVAHREAELNARQQYEEREHLIFDRWEVERAGLMEEMVDQENQYAHFDVQLAQEKFKNFAFRWTIFNKINKMKKFDRESYEFMKANLEIQEILKIDQDFRIHVATQKIRAKRDKFRDDYYRVLGDICDIRFENNNFKRLIAQKDKIIETLQMKEETLQNNLYLSKTKIKELENQLNTVTKDNINLREMVKNIEDKYQTLCSKLEKIKDQQNLSILDLKHVFGATDKNLFKNRLIDEINEVLLKIVKKMRKMHQFNQKECKNQILGTDIRNINRDICYKVEYGEGILVQQETQIDKIVVATRDIQTDDSSLMDKLKELEIQIEDIDNQQLNLDFEQNLENGVNNPVQQATQRSNQVLRGVTNKSHLISSKMSSIRSSSQNNTQKQSIHRDFPYKNKDSQQLKLISESQNFNSNQLLTLQINDSQQSSRIGNNLQRIMNHSKKHSHSFRGISSNSKSKGQTGGPMSFSHQNTHNIQDQDENELVEPGTVKNQSKNDLNQIEDAVSNLDQTAVLEGKFDGNIDDQKLSILKDNVIAQSKQKLTKNQKLREKYSMEQLPQVFSRLWKQNISREEKMKVYRDKSREMDNQEWKQKMAGNNSLQKTYQGMSVYQDPNSGKCFVHLDELRQKIQQSVNDKQPRPSSRNINQNHYQPISISEINQNQTQINEDSEILQQQIKSYSKTFMQASQNISKIVGTSSNNGVISADNLFFNQDSSLENSPDKYQLPKIKKQLGRNNLHFQNQQKRTETSLNNDQSFNYGSSNPNIPILDNQDLPIPRVQSELRMRNYAYQNFNQFKSNGLNILNITPTTNSNTQLSQNHNNNYQNAQLNLTQSNTNTNLKQIHQTPSYYSQSSVAPASALLNINMMNSAQQPHQMPETCCKIIQEPSLEQPSIFSNQKLVNSQNLYQTQVQQQLQHQPKFKAASNILFNFKFNAGGIGVKKAYQRNQRVKSSHGQYRTQHQQSFGKQQYLRNNIPNNLDISHAQIIKSNLIINDSQDDIKQIDQQNL